MTSASINMSTSTKDGKTIKTMVKTYKLKGGGEKSITLTETLG